MDTTFHPKVISYYATYAQSFQGFNILSLPLQLINASVDQEKEREREENELKSWLKIQFANFCAECKPRSWDLWRTKIKWN